MAIKKWLGGTTNNTTNINIAANWSPSGVPATGDDVYVEPNPAGADFSMAVSLTLFAAVSLNSFNVSQGFGGNGAQIGTTSAYLILGGTNNTAIAVNIGYQYGGTSPSSGSPLVRLDLGASLATVNVYNSSQTSSLVNAGPITLLGSHTSNVFNILGGVVSIASDPSETATALTVNASGTLYLGAGVTLTTLNIFGGQTQIRSGFTTVNQSGGSVSVYGTGTANTYNAQAGTVALNSNGTISTLNIYAANVSLANDPRPKTLTTVTGYNGGSISFNNGVQNSITFTNGVTVNAASGQFRITAWPNTNYKFA